MVWRVKKEAVCSTPANSGVLLPLADGMPCYGNMVRLNDTGRLIWTGLCGGRTEPELLAMLLAEFEVSRDTAAEDLREFLEDLRRRGLIEETTE